MSKYSSDSDSYSSNKKYYSRRSRERSFSSDSSSSRNKRYKDIKKSKREESRSRGSEKYTKHKNDRSVSYQTKFYSKSSRHSISPDRSRKRSTSRERYKLKHRRSRERLRRSRSNDSKGRYKKSKKADSKASSKHKDKSPTDSSSSHSSYDRNEEIKYQDFTPETSKTSETIKNKLKKLTVVKDEDTKLNSSVLDEINEDHFQPKTFSSSKTKKNSENIVIDLKTQTIKIPDVEIMEPDSIFHPSLFLNEDVRMEKWIKELFVYRQKALSGDLLNA